GSATRWPRSRGALTPQRFSPRSEGSSVRRRRAACRRTSWTSPNAARSLASSSSATPCRGWRRPGRRRSRWTAASPPRTRSRPWAEASVNRLSVPPSTVHPVVTRLPNGLQLIVQPESISHTVRVYGHVRNNPDLETPPAQEGIDEVLDRLLSFGTTSLDRLAYQGELDRIAADASAGTDFSLEVVADQ